MVYSSINFQPDPWKEEEEKKRYEENRDYEARKAQEDKAFKESIESEVNQNDPSTENAIDPKTGGLKSSHAQKDPKDFGPKEVAQELGNAVTGAAIDIADSIVAVPQKLVDPRFYTNYSDGPYRPDYFVLPSDYVNPMTKTVWGNLIRRVGEFGGLMALTRRAAGAGARVAPGAAKAPLNYLAKGPTMTPQPAPVAGDKLGNFQRSMAVKGGNLGKNIVHGAVVGAPADLIASTSTEANLARELINIRPDWEDALEPLATNESMSPAQRSLYNMFEGLGLGPIVDIAGEGAIALFRGLKGIKKGATAVAKADPIKGDEFITKQLELSRKQVDLQVEVNAKQQVENDFVANPLQNKPWKSLTEEEKYAAKLKYAKKRGLDWGNDEHPSIKRQEVQDTNETDVAIERLKADPQGVNGFDGYINTGGESIQGRATSTAKSPLENIRSLKQVYTDPRYADGSPNSVFTQRSINLMNSQKDGRPMSQSKAVKDLIDNDPDFRQFVESLDKAGKSVNEYLEDAVAEIEKVMAGRTKISELSDEEFSKFFIRDNKFEGFQYYSNFDHAKAALIAKTLNSELTDFATAAKSVEGMMDVRAKDGLFDLIKSRWIAVGRGIKESNYLRSAALGTLRDDRPIKEGLIDIANNVEGTWRMLEEAIDGDKSDDLLKLVLDAFSGSKKLQTWSDLDTFFRNKLVGYADKDSKQQNAVLRELGTMMTHSTISGPKTPVRAAFGTGFVTYSRPVFAAIGASIRGDQRQLKSSMHQIYGLFEATSDAWKIFKTQLKTNFTTNDLPDIASLSTIYTKSAKDIEWEMMENWVQTRGGEGAKAWFYGANFLRWFNRNPFVTWSSRVMNAQDVAFQTVIGKQQARGKAFLKAYDEFTDAGIEITDETFPKLLNAYEGALEREIFDDSGLLRDDYAKYAAAESAMTLEMPKMVRDLEAGFAANPLLRPFFMFARTGYNALELTSKHTPFLNNFVKEVHNIKNLPTGHPDLFQYGIRNADEHEAAKALIQGREAMGTMTIMGAVSLYLSGRLTGNGPSDKQLRDARLQQGWQPRSVLLPTPNGPAWISYDSLEPFNGFLAFVADVGDVSDQMGATWTERMLASAGYLLAANVINRSFFFGLSQLADLWDSGPDNAGRVAANIANSYVPMSSMRNEIGRFFNPGMRELEAGFWDSIKNRNLWAGEIAGLPYKYDVLNGQPLKMYDVPTRMWNAVMPFQMNMQVSQTRQTLFRALYDLKTTVNTMPGGDGDIPTTLKSRWQFLIGKQNVESQLARLFKNKQIMASIAEMEMHRDSNKPEFVRNDPMTYLHNQEIKKIFERAKENALIELQKDSEASMLLTEAKQKKLAAEARKRGRYNQAEQLMQHIYSPLK